MTDRIPHCNELVLRFFAPRYADWQVEWLELRTTRPDITTIDDWVGHSVNEICSFDDAKIAEYTRFLTGTLTTGSIQNIAWELELEPPVTMEWVREIDKYYDVDRIAELIDGSDASDENNAYFLRAIEVGAIIALVLRGLIQDLEWYPDPPYWEAGLWHAPTGRLIPPTHLAIKKLSSYGWDDGLVEKLSAIAGILNAGAGAK